MPKYKPWLKMWAEWLGDPKMDSLSLAEQGAWWRLISLAHQCANDGALTEGGLPMSMEAIMKSLKISDELDRAPFKSMVDKMTIRKSIHHNGDTMIITNYKRRQEMMPSNLPEAVAERQREHRRKGKEEKESHEKVVTSAAVSPLTTPTLLPESKNKRQRQRKGRDVTTEMSHNFRDEAKKCYLGNVFLSDIEYSKLIEKFGEVKAKDKIEALSLYIKSKGAEHKYKDHYATILNWDRMEQGRQGTLPLDKRKSEKGYPGLPTKKDLLKSTGVEEEQ